jgi:hypothetical protein
MTKAALTKLIKPIAICLCLAGGGIHISYAETPGDSEGRGITSRGDQEGYVHEPTGITLPSEIGGMVVAGDIINFEEKQPGLGIGRNYTSPGSKASIYIYNLGLDRIEENNKQILLDRVYAMAENEIKSLEEMGLYSDVENRGKEYVEWGDQQGTRGQVSSFSYTQGGKKLISYIYIIAVNDYFLKVRISHEEFDNSDQRRDFLRDLGNLIPENSKSRS